MLPRDASKEEKRKYLMEKLLNKKPFSLEDIKKYGVFWRPEDKEIDSWKLISVCSSIQEARDEIQWRAEYHKTNNGDLVLDNDDRFETYKDETLHKDENGNEIEHTDDDMVNPEQQINAYDGLLQSLPESKSNYRSMAHYANIELNYKGYYKIDEIYDVS